MKTDTKIVQRNKMAVCEWVLPVKGVHAVEMTGSIGFDGIQIGDLGGSQNNFPLTKEDVQEEYLAAAEKSFVTIQALHLYTLVREGGMTKPVNSPQGEAALRSIRAGIQACEALHIPKLMLTAGFACQIENEQDFSFFAEMLKHACDIGAEHGVSIVFESILLANDILRMCETVGRGLKVCYDIFNPIRFKTTDPISEIKELGIDPIDHYHLKDGPADLIGCTLLGKGCGKFSDTSKAILDTGYSGWFVSENYYAQPPLSLEGDPTALAKKDLLTMRSIFINK